MFYLRNYCSKSTTLDIVCSCLYQFFFLLLSTRGSSEPLPKL